MKAVKMLTTAAVAAAMVGCATPSAVYELADKSSANAALFGQHLGTLGTQSRALAEKRAAHVASMDAFNASVQADYQRDLAITRRAGAGDAAKRLIDDLSSFVQELERIEKSGQLSEAARRQELMNSYVALEPNTAALRNVANMLTALANQESRADRAKFLADFAAQVHREAQVLLEKDEASSKHATQLLEHIGQKLTPESRK